MQGEESPYHTKKMCDENIPIIFIEGWKKMFDASIVYLK